MKLNQPARGAGDSIKPGASAPRIQRANVSSPRRSLSEKSISVPLCDLCASVVSVFSSNFTTETQRFSRRHGEMPFFRQTPERATAVNANHSDVQSRETKNILGENAHHEICRPIRGLTNSCALIPGAHAPGFMLSRAPRAF